MGWGTNIFRHGSHFSFDGICDGSHGRNITMDGIYNSSYICYFIGGIRDYSNQGSILYE